jgi:hypothetical protein
MGHICRCVLATVKKDKTNEILQNINNTAENINLNLLWKKNKTTNSLSSTFFWQELMTAQYKHRFIERKRVLINYWTLTVTIPINTNCIETLFNWNDTHACTVTQNVKENKQNVTTCIQRLSRTINYPQRCIVQTSKKIGTQLTEHKDAIKRYDISGHFPLDTHMAIVTHLTEHTLNYIY